MSQICDIPVFLQNIHLCWYSVGQAPENDEMEEKILGTITGNYGEKWQEFLVDLTETQKSFQLFVEAVIGPSYLGDIAVDDIQLLSKEKCDKVRFDVHVSKTSQS